MVTFWTGRSSGNSLKVPYTARPSLPTVTNWHTYKGHIERWSCSSCSVMTDADIRKLYRSHKVSAREVRLTAHITPSACSKNSGSASFEDGQWPRVTVTSWPPATTHERAKGIGTNTLEVHVHLTAAIELKLDEDTRLKWMEHSCDSETTPSYRELLKFLHIQACHHESVAHSVRPAPKVISFLHVTHGFSGPAAYALLDTYALLGVPRSAYAAGPENPSVAGKKENHLLRSCGQFQRMTLDERWAIVKINGCCMTCLKVGHMASKCRAHSACMKFCKAHHMLLHINSNKPPEESRTETVSTVTYVL